MSPQTAHRPIGGRYFKDGHCEFTVWAPKPDSVALHITEPEVRVIPMGKVKDGYWSVELQDVTPDARYFFRLDEEADRPDPASHFQPDTVHAASQVVDHSAFRWSDDSWRGVPLQDMIIYELHIGTFTPGGTFDTAAEKLDALVDLGVTAVEIMPVSQFPGDRNWGYDGVYPFAVQNSYGGPDGLKRFVDRCHAKGLAVVLDVVYNHLGPEGAYVREFGYYFTDRYQSPWGDAMNFDSKHSDPVRNYFIQNALHWFEHYHIDTLRLDAIQGIYDLSAVPFLQELGVATDEYSRTSGRQRYLIAESDLNNSQVVRSRGDRGYGLHAQWSDDFHHSLHALITGQRNGYYADFGTVADLATAIQQEFVYAWRYSDFRKRHHGNCASDLLHRQFVHCSQNHDQVGNQPFGQRTSHLSSFEALKVAAGSVILAPGQPLLFMGEEYGEQAPFLYFVSHSDPDLVQAVREGRKKEFAHMIGDETPPDPADPETFRRSKLNWDLRTDGRHAALLEFYKRLIAMRKEIPAYAYAGAGNVKAEADEARRLLIMHRWANDCRTVTIMNFSDMDQSTEVTVEGGGYRKRIASCDKQWAGPGGDVPEEIGTGHTITIPAQTIVAYVRE